MADNKEAIAARDATLSAYFKQFGKDHVEEAEREAGLRPAKKARRNENIDNPDHNAMDDLDQEQEDGEKYDEPPGSQPGEASASAPQGSGSHETERARSRSPPRSGKGFPDFVGISG